MSELRVNPSYLFSFYKLETASDKISKLLQYAVTAFAHPEMSLFFYFFLGKRVDKFANFEFGAPYIASCYFDFNMEKPPFIALQAGNKIR